MPLSIRSCKCCNLGNMLSNMLRFCQGHWPCCFQTELWSFRCTSILRRQKHGSAAATWPHEAQLGATRRLEAPEAECGAAWCKRTDMHRPFHRDSQLPKRNQCTVGRWKFGSRLNCYQQVCSETFSILVIWVWIQPPNMRFKCVANTTYSIDVSMFRGSVILLTHNDMKLWRSVERPRGMLGHCHSEQFQVARQMAMPSEGVEIPAYIAYIRRHS